MSTLRSPRSRHCSCGHYFDAHARVNIFEAQHLSVSLYDQLEYKICSSPWPSLHVVFTCGGEALKAYSATSLQTQTSTKQEARIETLTSWNP